jgi:very-long-chain ceramide synthase
VTQQYKCWISQYITFGLLASLQAVNLFWLFLILRIAKNYVITAVATDVRSDNEEDDEEETGEEDKETAVGEERNEKKKDKVDVKEMIEGVRGMETDKPAVLLNGKPLGSGQAHPEGVVERKKKR